MKNNRLVTRFAVALCFLFVLALFVGCTTTVTWQDADGSVLETMLPEKDEAIPERPLPADNDDWHYIGWTEIIEDNQITYVAERIAKTKVTWLDADGTTLNSVSLLPEETIPTQTMPRDTEDWLYTGWSEAIDGNTITYTATRVAKTKIVWRDTDGTLLHTQSIIPSASIPTYTLPANSASWIYTGWEKTESENLITFTALRTEAKTVIWTDADGKQLEKQYMPANEDTPTRALPTSNKWEYTEWVETVTGDTNKVYTYTAAGMPKLSYFAGNIFQIIAKDLAGNPQMIGTGFVVNKEGWFITNYHVLEGSFLADAVFEIRNYVTNESFTTLEIEGISFFDKDKDIAIGKIKNYASIVSHYKNIPLSMSHNVGDVTYSIGYPNAAKNMQIHEGKVLDSLAGLEEKLYSGIQYIASDSFVAPGSSGGILINDEMKVIGLVTRVLLDENEEFVLSASIESFNFQGFIIQKTKSSMLKNIGVAQFAEAKNYVAFFESLKTNRSAKLVSEEGVKYYELTETTSGYNSSGLYYEILYTYSFFGTGEIVAEHIITWGDGMTMAELLYGNYMEGWDSFCYVFGYEWADGSGYYVYSEHINYSLTIDATLRNYEVESIKNYVPTQDNIRYTKEQFNSLYKKTVTMID